MCHEVQAFGSEIVIDDVNHDPTYARITAPARYGFRKLYLSVADSDAANGHSSHTLRHRTPALSALRMKTGFGMFRLFTKDDRGNPGC